jgi:ParB-like chromosome segregation protein Spo0J
MNGSGAFCEQRALTVCRSNWLHGSLRKERAMATSIRFAFQLNVVVLKIVNLKPSRQIETRERKEQKYRQIETSLANVGLVEPLVVFPIGKGIYRVLDGHKRLDILSRQNVAEVECLLATDDEAYTYNKRANYLSAVGEHQMILRALKHNSEEDIAKALAVDVRTVRRKRNLLNGICKEAVDFLKDRRVSPGAFYALRRLKPVRQVEVAQLMLASNRYSEPFAKALLAGTRADMLAEPDKLRFTRSLSTDQKIGIERETDALLHDMKAAEESYGKNVLALSVSCRYISRMLANGKVRNYIEGRFPDILGELDAVIASVDLDSTEVKAAQA